ncbi:MAG: helix-turn-helix transcriptional regulator [Acidimicrobiales bacterium]|nr:helix-turn-helix transcriptional regulator [Acidimicrobiales bacterium]
MTTPVNRPTGRDEVVEAILDAADRLFSAHGPADVSLRGIAREANVNHGLVHRHFGTRDDLIDRLLERMATDWSAEVEATGDYTAALDRIMSTPTDAEGSAGTWLRLLALSLLTDSPTRSAETQRRYGTALDALPRLAESEGHDSKDAAITTAAALALVYGWRLFHPYLRAVLHLDDEPFDQVHEAVRAKLRILLEP